MADVNYIFSYFDGLNPQNIELAFLFAGLVPPKIQLACELGFGQGVSINIHAAASEIEWFGTDFNPAHAAFAKELGAASGAKIHLFDDSFEEFACRTDLPSFDFICLHGIWSWISPENQKILLKFIEKKLNVGGVLYISYNSQPGWSAMIPVRHLLREHTKIMDAPGKNILSRIGSALDFVDSLFETNPLFLQDNPRIKNKLKNIKEQNRHYLAHEYFNQHWYPIFFAEMQEVLEAIKLNFACSASYIDHTDALNLTKEQQTLLNSIGDHNFKESVRDFIIDRQFRADYWVKGVRKLSKQERANRLRKIKVLLNVNKEKVDRNVKGAIIGGSIQESIFHPLIEALGDQQIHSILELENILKPHNIQLDSLVRTIMLLIAQKYVSTVQEEQIIKSTSNKTHKLNQYLLGDTSHDGEINYLVSPITGGGVFVNNLEKMFIKSINAKITSPENLAQEAWQELLQKNQKLNIEGKNLESEDENIAKLIELAKEFQNNRLLNLKTLQIISNKK